MATLSKQAKAMQLQRLSERAAEKRMRQSGLQGIQPAEAGRNDQSLPKRQSNKNADSLDGSDRRKQSSEKWRALRCEPFDCFLVSLPFEGLKFEVEAMAASKKPSWNRYSVEVFDVVGIRDYRFLVEPYRQLGFLLLGDQEWHEHLENPDAPCASDMSDMHRSVIWFYQEPGGTESFSQIEKLAESLHWPWIAHFHGKTPDVAVRSSTSRRPTSLDANATFAIEKTSEVGECCVVHDSW